MSEEWQGNILVGGWRPGGAGAAPVIHKSTGEVVGTVGQATAADVREAAARARNAQTAWAQTSGQERARILRRAADELVSMQSEIVGWLRSEGGQVTANAMFETTWSPERFVATSVLATAPIGQVLSSLEGEASYARRVPVGVVGAITPWNAPLVLGIRAIAPALALGNAVVMKPDSQTAVCGGVMIALALARAGLPTDLFHLVPGGPEVGEALVDDPNTDMITFTGSTEVGRRVGAAAGQALKRVSLELGGNNAMIVLQDADIEAAVSAASFGSFINQGQVCMATGRHLVHESILEDYLSCLVDHASRLPVGDPTQADVALGPMINTAQLARVDDIVETTIAQGAKKLTGGRISDVFYGPTVLRDVTPKMAAFRQEIFGPVAPVTPFTDDEEAVALANDTEYGLAASIQTTDPERGRRLSGRLRAGMVHVNDQTVNDQHTAPMGGFGASGNGSRFGPQADLDEWTQWQWLTVREVQKGYPF